MQQVGWGMVGIGGIAATVGPVFAITPSARLVGVAARDPQRTAAFAARHGAARSYEMFEALLADPEIEAVYLGTPNWLHAEQTIQALAAGKHVLVEKPMAITVADAAHMVSAARDAGRVLGVGFHLRYQSVIAELRRRLRDPDFGTITLAQAQWGIDMRSVTGWKTDPALAGAGSVMGLGVHLIDLLRWLIGREITAVTAWADGPGATYPVDFLMSALLEFDGGAFGQITCSRRLPHSANGVTVYTPTARLTGAGALSMRPEGTLILSRDTRDQFIPVPLENPYANEIEAFSRAVRERVPFAASGEDGLQVVRVTSALLEASARGRRVLVDAGVTA
jgi:1,5-anhydro-D-fructose reductase (1,5-anhydro-D-mannitol-forming)